MNICWYCGEETDINQNIYFRGFRQPFHFFCFKECAEMKLKKDTKECLCGCGLLVRRRRVSGPGNGNWFIEQHFIDIVGQDLLEEMFSLKISE